MTQRQLHLTADEPQAEILMPKMNKRRRRKKPGKKPLVEGEKTKRATTNLGETLFAKAERRAGRCGMSAYIRSLVENDLQSAS